MPGGQPPMPGGPPPKPFAAATPMPAGPAYMQYMRSYSYIFENPNWMMNVLWGFLCMLIPLVGPLVYLGYMYEIIEMLLFTAGARYPDFDVNRFGDYLMRGLWPFLVQMVVGMVMAVIIVPVMFIGMAIIGALADGAGDAGGALMGLGLLLLFALYVVAIIGVNLVMLPMLLRAGLTQEFAEAFKFGWVKDFIRRMWLEMTLVALFVMATSIPLMILGYLALCVGIYASMAVLVLASGHLNYQLYSIYLNRGGEPIPLKPRFPQQMTAPPPMPQY